MEEKIITFSANEQGLQKTGGISHYASDTVSYVKAVFDLGENWQGFDEVRAVFKTSFDTRSAVLNSLGECEVPFEILMYKAVVRVNLVGSIITEEEVTDRLTTYSVEALTIDEDVPISGDSSVPITPSEYEQFVANVANDANRAEAGASNAESEAESALASAQASEASALRASGHAQNAQSAETSARAYAQNAQNYATDAENAKDDAIDAMDEIRSMRAEAQTLEPNESATASYSNGVLTLGIPKGQKGDTGDTGASAGFGTVSASVDDSTGTPSVEVTASGTDTAKNFAFAFHNLKGAKGDKGDDGTVPDLDLILPTDTASGDIASITDGQNVVPVKSLKVTLEPIQDLHGYDKPWAEGSGDNQYNPNNQTIPSYANVNIVNERINATWTNGTLFLNGKNRQIFPAGTYTMWGDGTNIENIVAWRYTVADNTESQVGSLGTGHTFTTTEPFYIGLSGVSTGGTASFGAMLVKGNVTPTAWTPYENICPISGHTECVTEVCGKNLFDGIWESGAISNSNGENIASNASIRTKNFIPLKGGRYYVISWQAQSLYMLFMAYKADGTFSRYISAITANPAQFSLNEDEAYIRFYAYNNTVEPTNMQIELGTTATSYEPYNGHTYTTDLGRTVYGGTLDVVSGELVVDMAMVTFDGSSDETWLKDADVTSSDGIACFRAYLQNDNIKKPEGTAGTIDYRGKMFSNTMPTLKNGYINQYPMADTVMGVTGYSGASSNYFYINVNKTLSNIQSVAELMAQLAENPTTVVYELATPQTYQLDPQTISLLHGNNNVWSDGSVVMVYNADVGLYIDKKLGTSGTTSLSMTRTLAKSEDTDDTKSDNIQLAED